MAEQKYASFAPEAIKETNNSKLWDNVDVTVTAFKFTKEMPNGYVITPKEGEEISPVGAVLDFEIAGNSPIEERRVNQFFSLGAKVGLSFDISANGYGLNPKAEDSALYRSNFTRFVKSMIENGLPSPVVAAGDFSKIVGLQMHVKRIEDKDGKPREWTDKKGEKHTELPKVLLCTKVIALPKAGGVTTATVATAASSDDFDLDSTASELLVAALNGKKGKPQQRSQLVLLVSQQANSAAEGSATKNNRAVIAKRAAEEDFLNNLNELGIVKYDAAAKGQPVSLPEAA